MIGERARDVGRRLPRLVVNWLTSVGRTRLMHVVREYRRDDLAA